MRGNELKDNVRHLFTSRYGCSLGEFTLIFSAGRSRSRRRSRSKVRSRSKSRRRRRSRSCGARYSYKDEKDCDISGAKGKDYERLLKDAEVEGSP